MEDAFDFREHSKMQVFGNIKAGETCTGKNGYAFKNNEATQGHPLGEALRDLRDGEIVYTLDNDGQYTNETFAGMLK